MIFLGIVSIVIIGFFLAVCYFFSLAFVRCKTEDLEDLNAEINKPLRPYKEIIDKGIEYTKAQPHKTVTTVSFDGLTLYADYYDNKSDKTAILFHGYRSSAVRDFSCAVKMYTGFGFNVMLCDQRSHGRSEGNIISFGIKESYDVVAWAEFVAQKFGAQSIMLGGMSMGATTVILSLAHNLPSQVKAVVSDCGFTCSKDILKKVGYERYKIKVSMILPFLNLFCKAFGKFSLNSQSTIDVLKKSDMPVLFIHGKDDSFVPCEMSETAYKNANKKCRMLLVDKADHGFSYLVDRPAVENELGIFLKQNSLI